MTGEKVFVSPDGERHGPVNVIEVRACQNGYVVSVFWARMYEDGPQVRGYDSRVVEGFDPDKLGAAVAEVLRKHSLDPNVAIAPARKLP